MRLSLHTVICCCVFTTVMPPTKGTTGEPNASLKKRFRVQSHMKRDLHNTLVTANEQYSDIHVGPKQDGHAKTLSPPSSFGLNIRLKRSTSSKTSRCALSTCLYQDLVHLLYQMSNEEKKDNAPEKRMGRDGYGRRRRSLLDVTQLALQTGRQRRNTEADRRVSRYKSTRTLA